nr:MAG TPA: hypothetical protein [Caudoviricetes sp.]DAQ53263.1 MAG TPA: hypothetical protein [Caudoviricetes sp.]
MFVERPPYQKDLGVSMRQRNFHPRSPNHNNFYGLYFMPLSRLPFPASL